MRFSTILSLTASIALAQGLSKGFNSGAVKTDGTPRTYDDFSAEFKKSQNLPGTSGWNSIRLYTMIQGGTTNDPISAIKAAIDTETTMLLGLWTSAGEEIVQYELDALSSALSTYGSKFSNLVVGISVGSEDLYRNSVTGAANDAGIGADPDVIVDYIKQTRKAIAGTKLSDVPIGHVDTWDVWQNGSNSAVIDNCDWVGMDTYPYFEYQKSNGIENAKKLFWDAFDITKAAAGSKDIWITETGWPVSGKTEGDAVASVKNAETYWQEISCELQGNYNTYWYTLQDALPDTPNPSFGIIGQDINSAPKYDLSCSKNDSSTSSLASSKKSSHSSTLMTSTSTKKNGDTVTKIYAAKGSNASATGASKSYGSSSNSTVLAGTAVGPTSSVSSSTETGSAASVSSPASNAAASLGPAIGVGILAVLGFVEAF